MAAPEGRLDAREQLRTAHDMLVPIGILSNSAPIERSSWSGGRLRWLLLGVIVIALVAGTRLAGWWPGERASAANRLERMYEQQGRPGSCTRAGVTAFAGGGTSVYRCTMKRPADIMGSPIQGFEAVRCAVWVDGAGHDVTSAAWAQARLDGRRGPC